MKFKAAVLTEINKPLTIAKVETTEIQIGQVLVKVLVSGLCGAQLQELAGLKGNEKFLPHLMGHEGCGIVEQIGPGVTTVKVGDKVVMHWRKGDGIEASFPSYIFNNKMMSSGKVTTLSEYSVVSENRLTSVPHDTPDELCALLGCGMTTALGVITNEAGIKLGETVLVLGCGGVGLNLIQGANLVSAYPIIGADVSEDKRKLCKEVGATHFINTTVSSVHDVVGKGEVDVIIDTTGNPQALANVLPLLSGNGRCILVGQPKPGQDLTIPNGYSLFDGIGKVIKATQGGKTTPSEDIPRYVKLSRAGLLDVSKLVTHRFELRDINQAFDLLKTGRAGRIMIYTKTT